ncbi:MAG: hypothetical protein Q9181_006939 [Wetmoreana brouardii]
MSMKFADFTKAESDEAEEIVSAQDSRGNCSRTPRSSTTKERDPSAQAIALLGTIAERIWKRAATQETYLSLQTHKEADDESQGDADEERDEGKEEEKSNTLVSKRQPQGTDGVSICGEGRGAE